MENYNNRKISISGDPASGKGSVTAELKKRYESKGFKVTIMSMGQIFREITQKEYMKKFPDAKDVSLETICKDPNFAEELKYIDSILDAEVKRRGEQFDSIPRPNEMLIGDGRVIFLMMSNTFSVKLTTDPETAGERVFNDPKRGPEDQYSTIEEAIASTESRRKAEIERFKKTYGVDLTNQDNFKLIIGTTLATVEDIANTIEICEELYRQGKPFAKTWASPELFYPTQRDAQTYYATGESKLTLPQIAESIKKCGIYPDRPVYSKTITDSPYQFVAEGHHRVYGSIIAGLTLIPYEAKGNVDKASVSSSRELSSIYDNEELVRKPDGKPFRYKKYPVVDERSRDYDRYY